MLDVAAVAAAVTCMCVCEAIYWCDVQVFLFCFIDEEDDPPMT